MEDDNKTDQIKAEQFPEGSISIFLKLDGKLYTKGVILQEVKTGDGMYRTIARIKAATQELLNSVFYVAGERPKSLDMEAWYEKEQKTRRNHDRLLGVPEEDLN